MENKVVQRMARSKLVCKPQIREWFDEESMTGLAQSIKESGVLQPLLVRREGAEFVVTEGERRLRAAEMAGLTDVPVIIDDRELSGAEVLERQFATNSQREDLTPLEKARAIDGLMKITKCTAAQVALKLGLSPSMVSKLLALLNLPESIQRQVANGSLALSAAYEISRADDAESQNRLAQAVVQGELTRERIVRERSRPRTSSRQAATKAPRRRIAIPFGGGSLAVSSNDTALETLVAQLLELIERLKGLADQRITITEAVKMLAPQA